jgi:hypothetical protein
MPIAMPTAGLMVFRDVLTTVDCGRANRITRPSVMLVK